MDLANKSKEQLAYEMSYLEKSMQLFEVFESICEVDGCTIKKCTNTEVEVLEIPFGIEEIGASVFSACKNLKSITIPLSVKFVKDNAFAIVGNKLEEVNYIGTLEEWAQINFSNGFSNPLSCGGVLKINGKAITHADFSEGFKQIECQAFYGYKHLKEVTIPESVTRIGFGAFRNCFALEKVNYNAVDCRWFTANNKVFYSAGRDNGITLFIGNKVKSIPEQFFCSVSGDDESDNLTEIIFEENPICEKIGKNAFNGCKKLKNIVIPSCVAEIEEGAFGNCTGVKELTLSYKEITQEMVKGFAFVKKLTLGDGCEKICDNAFNGFEYIKEIILPDSVKFVGKKAFGGCSCLIKAELGAGIEDISYDAFMDCTGLLEVYNKSPLSITTNDFTLHEKAAYFKLKNIYTPTYGESKMVKDENGFTFFVDGSNYIVVDKDGLEDITELIFPDHFRHSMYKIGSRFCMEKENLTKVVLSRGVKDILTGAFYNCKNLKTLVIEDGLEYIASFGNCESLTEVTLPNSVTTIGTMAFNGCVNLEKINMPKYLTTVDFWAFKNCKKLQSLTFSDGIKTVHETAFSDCTSLQEITCPKKVKGIIKKAIKKAKLKCDLIVTKW